MVQPTSDAPASPEPVRCDVAERPATDGKVQRIGRVRLPLSLHHAPWATLYRLPDGRRWWIVRLWEVDRSVPTVVSTGTLRAFCRGNGFPRLLDEVDRLAALASRGDHDE